MPTPSRLTLGMFCTLLFGTPFAAALYLGVDFTEYANESLSYRFFLSERLFSGHSVLIWNGHIASLIHHLGYWILDRSDVLPAMPDLRGRAQLFSIWALGFPVAAAGALMLLAACDKKITTVDLTAVGMVLLVPVWCTGFAGFYYSVLPDYYVVSVVLLAVAVWASFRTYRKYSADIDFFAASMLGTLGGLLATNKLYLAIMIAPSLVNIVFAPKARWSARFAALLVCAVTATTTFAVVIWAFALFDWDAVVRLINYLKRSLGATTGEHNILSPSFWAHVKVYGYHWHTLFWISVTSVALFVNYKHKNARGLAVALVCFAIGVLSLTFLAKRASGTTAFEISAMLFAAGIMAWPTLERNIVSNVRWLILASMITITLVQIPYSAITDRFHRSKPEADLRWEMFQETIEFAAGRPLLVVIPDNEYHHEGVFEFLIKGLSQFPTWDMNREGKALLNKYAPGLMLTHDMGGAFTRYKLPSNSVVLWFEWPGRVEFSDRHPRLSDLRRSTECRYWTITKKGSPQVEAIACPTGSRAGISGIGDKRYELNSTKVL